MTRLAAHDLCFRYDRHEVLRGVDLSLDAGTCLAVVGSNGCGKTTLVRLCIGREIPARGRVTLDDRILDDDDPWVRRHVAALTGPASHYPDLTVREHLELVAVAHGTPQAERDVEAALVELRLDDLGDALPQHLSSGQAQALRLAALRVRPRHVVVLDEPEQHLDPGARAAVANWIAAEARAGTAVLLVSHDPTLVEACADRVLTLRQGRLHDTPVPAVLPVEGDAEVPREDHDLRPQTEPDLGPEGWTHDTA